MGTNASFERIIGGHFISDPSRGIAASVGGTAQGCRSRAVGRMGEDCRGGEHRRFHYWRRKCLQRARVSRPTSSQEATRAQVQLRRAQATAQQYRGEPASERRRLGVAGLGNSVAGHMPRWSKPTRLNLVNGGGPQPLQPPGLFNQGDESEALEVQVEKLARDLLMLTHRLGGSGPNYSGAAAQGGSRAFRGGNAAKPSTPGISAILSASGVELRPGERQSTTMASSPPQAAEFQRAAPQQTLFIGPTAL